MVLVVRLEENDFVAGIEECGTGTVKGAGCSGADGHFRFRIGSNAVIAGQFVRDGLPQFRYAVEAGVDIVPIPDGLLRSLENNRRNRCIADSLCHIETLHARASLCHRPNFRLGKIRHPPADCSHHHTPS